ncbi:MAG: epoxyqueuosine reductase QueH [Bacilli bacterium]|nr:epoxyqueuosine reductase QueH [Bacilli bacterium]MDD4795253.1 epoxyqueuosine reductase QueH [Bacilli bacterium]
MNRLLLHSCCAPCSSSVIEKLKGEFSLAILFYNPNIEPYAEYTKRKEEQIKLLKKFNIDYLEIDYLNEEFKNKVIGFEKEKEGGKRCHLCYELRLEKAAELAKKYNFNFFTTTLTVSPYKNSKIINEIGKNLEEKYQVKYLISDFKKEDGYKKSIELSKKYNLYRQNYCGCLYGKDSYEK